MLIENIDNQARTDRMYEMICMNDLLIITNYSGMKEIYEFLDSMFGSNIYENKTGLILFRLYNLRNAFFTHEAIFHRFFFFVKLNVTITL